VSTAGRHGGLSWLGGSAQAHPRDAYEPPAKVGVVAPHLDGAVGESAEAADDALAPVKRGSRGGQLDAVTDLPLVAGLGHGRGAQRAAT
jgi:hypothetical protein